MKLAKQLCIMFQPAEGRANLNLVSLGPNKTTLEVGCQQVQ